MSYKQVEIMSLCFGNSPGPNMKTKIIYIPVFLLWLFFSGCSPDYSTAESSGRSRISFNDNWKFSLQGDSSAIASSFDDKTWRILNLPHDWSIEGAFAENNPAGVGGGALPGGLGWYRKTFQVNEEDKNRKIFIEFDGVYCNSEVWINGNLLGKRPNGYISFQYDLTPHLKFGQPNILVVKVDNSKQPNSRWYSGSGIYRNVWLTKTNAIFVDHWGTFVTTPKVSAEESEVNIKTSVRNTSGNDQEILLETIIADQDGKTISSDEIKAQVGSGGVQQFDQTIKVSKPNLWSIENPHLYTVRSYLKYNGQVRDSYQTKIGIRTFNFDSQKGFSLNDKDIKIVGVCNHHDLGCLGAAINTRALERQLEILKGMGINGIRTSHNPPAPELLDLCDRMGFIVMDEMFDMWKKKKNPYDYSLDWDQWHKQDLEDFIRRDRNHPSVMMWSIGNEIGEQWDSTGTAIAMELAGIVKSLDTTRPITTGNNEVNTYNNIIRSGVLDLIGYNYNHRDYADFHKRYPGKKFIATETTSALATRGHYDVPSDSIRRWPISWDKIFTQGNKDNTVSAYDHVSAPWGSTHEETWKVMKKHPHLSGMFIWTGFDYLGEPTPYVWPSRSSYFGVVDLAGFPKDTYYLYQSELTTHPVLHLFPHWNWNEGQVVDVWAYYNNADAVELFLNGVSQGVRQKTGEELHVMWRLKFKPGILKAVSRKAGKEVLVKEIKTAGSPYRLVLEADRSSIQADGNDLSFITVKVVDKDGNIVPLANNHITFSMEGNAKIAGVDNGNPTSHESFKANSRDAFNGLALLVLQSSTEKGDVNVKASSEGLESASIKINTTK
jgi:beta-galactosidase